MGWILLLVGLVVLLISVLTVPASTNTTHERVIPATSPALTLFKKVTPRLHFLILSSFDHPTYERITALRLQQLDRHRIPYTVAYNGSWPTGRVQKSFEVHVSETHMNKGMMEKTLTALHQLDVTSFDVLVRVNATSFIHLSQLTDLLSTVSHQKLAAGFINRGDYLPFLSGTAMILSSDVVQFLQQQPRSRFDRPHDTDDGVLSLIIRDYCDLTDWSSFYSIHPFQPTATTQADVYRKFVMIRVKSDEPNRTEKDQSAWQFLLKHFP